MKSTTYEDSFGAVRTGPPELQDPDTVEEIWVEKPLTSGLIEHIRDISRSRIVGPTARLVYLEYLIAGNHGVERQSKRATARALGIPWTTYWRARKELIEKGVLSVVRAGHRTQLVIHDIREMRVVQNEPVESVVHFEPVGISRTSRVGKVKVLISSKNRYKYDGVTSEDEYRESDMSNGPQKFDDLDKAFGPPESPPKVQRASAPSRRFKLKPPPGPTDERHLPRVTASAKWNIVPKWVYPKMLEVCFNATTPTQQRVVGTKRVRGRIADACHKLGDLGADFNRIGEFLTWWRMWAKGRPTPEVVVSMWLRAMEEIDEEVKKATERVVPLEYTTDEEYAQIVAALKERTQREYKGVAP